MNDRQQWYIVKQPDNTCEIIEAQENLSAIATWGGYDTKEEAIAKRIGLIRAGKCQPK
jgi:hypothetical protein